MSVPNFEADISIRSKIVRLVQKFRNWITWPDHALLAVTLWFIRTRRQSSVCIPNLKICVGVYGHLTWPRPLSLAP